MEYSLKEDLINYIFDKVKYFILPSKDNNYKSKFIQSKILFYCVVLLLILKIGATLISINFPQNIFFADITRSALENFANQTRQSLGLPALVENQKLNQAAQLKAENMVQNQYFNHVSPSGVTPWYWFLKSDYNYKYAGENLAIGFFESEEVYNAWLNSPSHKANIVNPHYTEVGTAVLRGFGLNNTIVVVQEFGSQLPSKIAATKTNTPKPTIFSTPSAIAIVQANGVNNGGKVLSQSTINSVNNLHSKVIGPVLYNYDNLLQNIIYGLSLVVAGVLLTLIFFNFNINFKRELIFRALLIIGLLFLASSLNKEVIVSFIPHQILI